MSLHRADLDNKTGVAHGIHDGFGVCNGRRNGLFNEDMLASRKAFECCRCMDPVGGGNNDRFNAGIVEKGME
jgi:hypothetical protein